MERSELGDMFNIKISLELKLFKKKMLKQSPEEIFARAYQIDCIINIYEFLLEMSREMEKERLKLMLAFPNLLAFLYSRWIKKEDSFGEELKDCLEEVTKEISNAYRKNVQEASVA